MKKAIYFLVFLVSIYASWFAAKQGSELGPEQAPTFWYIVASLYAGAVSFFAIYKTVEDDL